MNKNPSQTSIKLITESNIDSLLIKPVTQKNFQDALFQALANKIKPTEYHRALEKGKEHLNQDDLDQALAHFEKAQALDPRAALPFYYLGQGQEKKGNLQNAVQKYQGGLKINPIDYRCLIGLLDLHLSAKEFELAYEVAKRIHQTYPVSSTRFLGLVNLSIQVKKFTDVLDYYEAFKQIQKREPRMNRVIVAGMLVCAKYFLICNEIEKCRSVLSDAIKVAQETGEILPEVLRYCIETKNYELALDLYGKLPDDLLKTFEVQFLYIQIKYEQGDMESVVSFGTPLLQHAEVSLSLYELLIEASRLVGRNEKSIAALVDDAEARFPAARESLQKLMI